MLNWQDFNHDYNTSLMPTRRYKLYDSNKLKEFISIPTAFECILHISKTYDKYSYINIYDTTQSDKKLSTIAKQYIVPEYMHINVIQIDQYYFDLNQTEYGLTLALWMSHNDAPVEIKLLQQSAYEYIFKINIRG